MIKIVIVDYGTCNISSVYKTLQRQHGNALVCSSPQDIAQADKLILPGIGHFGHAMKNLADLHLLDALHEAVLIRKKPVLGICLGMQLMADSSDEGHVPGLGWISGRVESLTVKDPQRYKIPHIGWNTIDIKKESALMNGITAENEFYFTHSYHFSPSRKIDVLNSTEYNNEFVSAVERDHIFGVQYHPEKSHVAGSLILRNFAAL